MTSPRRPRLAVFKLASCDGCQLTLLDCEDELLAVAGAVDIVRFAEATSRPDDGLPFDLALIEGSVSTPEQLEHVRRLRARARRLVTIGACATAGGIQALRNWADAEEYLRAVYARPEYIRSLATSTPVSAHVPVDFELRGCPIDKRQLLELITATLVGRRPALRNESVCMECKRRGNVCVMVAKGEPCLGPVTHEGCGALCPSYDRGCYGCFGPRERANTGALAGWFIAHGMVPEEALRRFRGFNGWAEAFREESERHER
ncbi:NADH ubiquinone oxidoreductase [Sorangium cellulosum]|jgi:coenzyme F420-reducing hydrogenase gamma subunit|uniref:NADH ubiquinone oxidoreductase n=1 Tax=Sorangium cellulosum TaxID=56 RepID=A0A4P2Q4D2_SORCE|nr:oxidoreductase [Sorangium cellulosum]AUX24240.1 NADH ubiquinone oxidoreductase [Sorangium cellulosum]